MPELPEVETIRRGLIEHVGGLRIEETLVIWPKAVKAWEDAGFSQIIQGRRIEGVDRRGKYLLIALDEGWSLIAHMRMTGRLNYFPDPAEPGRHTHVIFKLERGRELHFSDIRKFGRIEAYPSELLAKHPSLVHLGPEPLEDAFTPDVLRERLRGRKAAVKAVLLDQTVLAGLGNIYADEALFLAGILPERAASSLTPEEIGKLFKGIREVLRLGIEARGTSFRDYRDTSGEKGSFQLSLQVYGRAGKPCLRCGAELSKVKIAGRTTVFCSECQR